MAYTSFDPWRQKQVAVFEEMSDDLIGEITAKAWNSFTDWHGLSPEVRCRPLEAITELLIRNN